MYDYYITQTPFFGIDIEALTVEKGITSIGEWAFYDCTSLTSIAIPDSVTNIGDYAFYGCDNLQYLKMPASLEISSSYVFDSAENLKEIVLSPGTGIMPFMESTYFIHHGIKVRVKI